MTKTQRKKAVRVATDVLAQIKARGKFVVTPGTYAEISGVFTSDPNDPWHSVKVADDLQTFLKKHAKPKSCHVCALGACFLANVEKTDNVPYLDSTHRRDEITENLSKIFSEGQMGLIEAAFERSSDYGYKGDDNDNTYDLVEAAVEFGERYDDPTKRLRAIMKNIIKNNGEFVPPDLKKAA
jgi:hypothetical protein